MGPEPVLHEMLADFLMGTRDSRSGRERPEVPGLAQPHKLILFILVLSQPDSSPSSKQMHLQSYSIPLPNAFIHSFTQ